MSDEPKYRIETDIEPINYRFFELCQEIRKADLTSPAAMALAVKQHAILLQEFGLTLNKLLAHLEFGKFTLTQEPPTKQRQYFPPNT